MIFLIASIMASYFSIADRAGASANLLHAYVLIAIFGLFDGINSSIFSFTGKLRIFADNHGIFACLACAGKNWRREDGARTQVKDIIYKS